MGRKGYMVFLIGILCLIISSFKVSAQHTPDKIKAYFLVSFLEHTDWPKEKSFPNYKISVLNSSSELKRYLDAIVKSVKIKQKPIKVNYVSSISNLPQTNLLFINEGSSVNYPLLLSRTKGKNILLVGMESPTDEIMINLIYKKAKIHYKINLNAIQKENLIVSKSLIDLAVSDPDDWSKLFSNAQEQLKNERTKVASMDSIIETQKRENELQKLRLKVIENQINLKKKEIENINREILQLSEKLKKKEEVLNQKDEELQRKKAELLSSLQNLKENEKKIKLNLEKIDVQQKEMEKQERRMNLQSSHMQEQQKAIEESESQISNLETLVFNFRNLLIIIGVLLVVAIWALYKLNSLKKQLAEANGSLEVKVKERTEDLVQKNKELEEFTFITSHDLQEPVNNVIMLSTMLKNDFGDQMGGNAKMFVDEIDGASSRLKDQINSILDFSRIGKTPQKARVRVDFKEIVEEAIKDLQPLIGKDEVNFTLPKEWPIIKGNKMELRLLFLNLISNAIKYNNKAQKEVSVLYRKIKNGYEFKVKDNGIGIDKKYFDKIFVIFQRLEAKDSPITGTGIGLAHCKKIVETHGGKISVESEIDMGTTFTFTLKTTNG